ncbi:MAG: hypothetical protein AAFV54_11030, partial [Pseudomonadota bacterium]
MTTLDRYIARQYLTNIIALLAILFCFVVTIDVSINADEFWKLAGRLAVDTEQPNDQPSFIRQATLTVLLIADLWWPR